MEQLKEMLESNYPNIDFDNETQLMSSGVLDSLAVVAIIAEIENMFDISVTRDGFLSLLFVLRIDFRRAVPEAFPFSFWGIICQNFPLRPHLQSNLVALHTRR